MRRDLYAVDARSSVSIVNGDRQEGEVMVVRPSKENHSKILASTGIMVVARM
jgi:hypothetical protein